MPAFSENSIAIIPPCVTDLERICELGGQFDECSFYVEFFDDCLDREVISSGLGLTPTSAWNAGEKHPVGNGQSGCTRIDDYGRWALKIPVTEGTISDAILLFFSTCQAPLGMWRELSERWNGRVSLVGHAKNWNREFSLSPQVVANIADRGLALNFDAYFPRENTDDRA